MGRGPDENPADQQNAPQGRPRIVRQPPQRNIPPIAQPGQNLGQPAQDPAQPIQNAIPPLQNPGLPAQNAGRGGFGARPQGAGARPQAGLNLGGARNAGLGQAPNNAVIPPVVAQPGGGGQNVGPMQPLHGGPVQPPADVANIQPPNAGQPGIGAQNALPVQPPINIANIPPPNVGQMGGGQGRLPPLPRMQPRPVPVPPVPMQPIAGGLAQLDGGAIPQLQRRWSRNVMAVLGLQSNASRDRIMASTIATAARIDETAFPPGQAAVLQGSVQPNDDQTYLDLIAAIDTFEREPQPRGQAPVDALRQAALAAQPGAQADPRQKAAVDSVLKQLRPYDLRDQVLALGQPTNWTSAQAAQASAAKVELDLLSLANPQAESLGADAGVNASFWIKKKGGTGAEDRSYICKPMADHSEVNGVPAGGEVAREALAARAAEAISRQTGLQIPIPETHVIALDPAFLPGNVQPGAGGKVMSSVQEVRPCQGAVKGTAMSVLAQVPQAQCQAIAIADTIMLNVDRHYGNMLMDGNNLVPIDHGGTFIDPNLNRGRGVDRITQALSTSHNCLLQMPGTHVPLTNRDRANLKQIDPLALIREMMDKRDELAQTMPDAMVSAPTVDTRGVATPGPEVMSNATMELTRRSAEFVKIAAGYQGISVATIQVAMAGAAKLLFDLQKTGPTDFEQIAHKVLTDARKNQAVMREACLLNDMENETVCAALADQGWNPNERGKPPANSVDCDPAFKLKLAAFGVRLDTTIGHGATPSKRGVKADQLEEMARAHSAIRTAMEKGRLDKNATAEEWACFEELKSVDPAEIADLARLGLTSPGKPLKPSELLAKVKQLRAARQAVANAEQENGGGINAIKNPVIRLKALAARDMLNMLRGPVKDVQQTAITTAMRTNDLAAVSTASNALFDLVRRNMEAEITSLARRAKIDQETEDDLKNLVKAGKLARVEQELARAGGNPRPDSI